MGDLGWAKQLLSCCPHVNHVRTRWSHPLKLQVRLAHGSTAQTALVPNSAQTRGYAGQPRWPLSSDTGGALQPADGTTQNGTTSVMSPPRQPALAPQKYCSLLNPALVFRVLSERFVFLFASPSHHCSLYSCSFLEQTQQNSCRLGPSHRGALSCSCGAPHEATSTHQLQWNQARMAAAALWLGNGESGKPGHFHVGPSPGQPRWCDSLQCWVSAALGVSRVWTHMLFFTVALATRGCGRSVFNSCLCLREAHLICLRSWGLVWQSFSLPHGCEIVRHKHSPPAGLEADCPFWGVTWDLSYIILSLIHVHCNILSLWHVHRSPEGISHICEFGDTHFPEPLTWMPKPLRSTGTKIFNSFLFLLLPTVMPLPESPLSKLSKFHS